MKKDLMPMRETKLKVPKDSYDDSEVFAVCLEPDDRIAYSIQSLSHHWMLTYDDVPEIRSLYSDLPSISKSLNYSAQVKRIGVEYMVFSNKVKIPDLEIKT